MKYEFSPVKYFTKQIKCRGKVCVFTHNIIGFNGFCWKWQPHKWYTLYIPKWWHLPVHWPQQTFPLGGSSTEDAEKNWWDDCICSRCAWIWSINRINTHDKACVNLSLTSVELPVWSALFRSIQRPFQFCKMWVTCQRLKLNIL